MVVDIPFSRILCCNGQCCSFLACDEDSFHLLSSPRGLSFLFQKCEHFLLRTTEYTPDRTVNWLSGGTVMIKPSLYSITACLFQCIPKAIVNKIYFPSEI